MNTTMNMTLEQLIQATELCGAGCTRFLLRVSVK